MGQENLPNIASLLSRVDLSTSIQILLRKVAFEYGLSNILQFELIGDGYEELNIRAVSSKGTYIIKIFSRDKTYDTIRDYVNALVEFSKAGIPVPNLLEANGDYLWKTAGTNGTTYLCVMEFFNGKNFVGVKPSQEDLRELTKYLAKIHALRFQIKRNYESWGTNNLVKEFEYKKPYLAPEDLRLIQPIVDQFREIDFNSFRRGIIHGDLQKQHVLKNAQGALCILDLGCVDFNAVIIDLAIFIAHFCFDVESTHEVRDAYRLIVDEYIKYYELNQSELRSLPLLIKATYAMYLMTPRYLLAVEKV